MDFTVFNMSFNNFTLVMGIIIGLILAILSHFYAEFWHKQIVKQTKKQFPNETIEHACMPLKSIMAISIFFLGVFIGSYILPFIFFKNITQIKMVTSGSLWYYIILSTLCCIYGFSLKCYSAILTNKRLIFTAPYRTLIPAEFLLTDIKNMELKKDRLNILFKNNSIFPIVPKKSAIICYEKINNLLELQQTYNSQVKGD